MLKSVLDLWSPNTQDQILKARRRSLGKFGNLPIEGTVQLDNQKRHLNLLSLQENGGRWEHTLALTNSGAQLQQLQQRHVQKSQDESSQSDTKNHSITSYVIIFAYICHICQDCHKYPQIITNPSLWCWKWMTPMKRWDPAPLTALEGAKVNWGIILEAKSRQKLQKWQRWQSKWYLDQVACSLCASCANAWTSEDPYPYRGGGRGWDKTNLSNSTFFCLETLG